MKNIRFFYPKIFIFLVVKFSEYFNRHVFVISSVNDEHASRQEFSRKTQNCLTQIRIQGREIEEIICNLKITKLVVRIPLVKGC